LAGVAATIAMGITANGGGSAQAATAQSQPGLATAGSDPQAGFVRLPGHVLDMLSRARLLAPSPQSRDEQLDLTLTLKRDDQAGFERYLGDVYDKQSKNFRHFLTQAQIAARFGPSRQAYQEALDYLRSQGFRLVQGSSNRMTLTVRGTRATVERSFDLHLGDYKLGDTAFYANDFDPALPRPIAPHVLDISGLSNLARPHHGVKLIALPLQLIACSLGIGVIPHHTDRSIEGTSQIDDDALYDFVYCVNHDMSLLGFGPALTINGGQVQLVPNFFTNNNGSGIERPPGFASAYSALRAATPPSSGAATIIDGTGQTVGLLEFDAFHSTDIANFLALSGAAPTVFNNVTTIPVNGGIATPGADEDEVLLDIDDLLYVAPGAKIKVFEAPFTGQASSYSAVFNAMITSGVTIISNSWASCEDQVSLADAQAIDQILQSAVASGISVFSGTGDDGSTCLDGSANTVSVPADSPNVTAVGGSSRLLGPGFTYQSETWWDGSNATPQTGQGGFGVSRYFGRPSYQNSLNAGTMRSIPDVVANADPAHGVSICQADAGGCPTPYLYGGTSSATPLWAGFMALLNQSAGQNLGSLNLLAYPLAGTNAFHGPAALQSDFAHVGLGSPNLDALLLALTHQKVGAVSASASLLSYFASASYFLGTSQAAGVPADGASPLSVVVRLVDANGNPVAGKTVTLAPAGSAKIVPTSGVSSSADGSVTFTVTDATIESLAFSATDSTDGITIQNSSPVAFVAPPATSAGISANPPTVTADGSSAATITIALKDSLNRPTPGKTVSVSAGGAHAVLTGPTPTVTDANGQIQFTATDQVNETVTFSAVDVTDGNLSFPGTATVTYSKGTATACNVGLVPVAASGYSITPLMTGLPASPSFYFGNVNWSCSGANFPAFAPSGAVLESDFVTGGVYETGLSGGSVSTANLLSNLNLTIANFVFTADGNLYATQKATTGDFTTGDIIQVDPTTGASLRVVASGLTCPSSLAVDPLSGDLFFDDECSGAGSNNASLFRLVDPAGTDTSRPTSVVPYTTLPSSPNGAIAFAPNGTIYVLAFGSPSTVEQVSATNAASVTVSPVAGITTESGIAIGATNADGSAQSLLVDPAGVLSEVSIANPTQTTVLATVSPGVGVAGPDGCLYSAHYDTVYRLANSTGGCTFAPTSPAPALSLTPTVVAPSPAQGSTETFTATLQNVSAPSGVPVYFVVQGANSQVKVVDTDADGKAVLQYTAEHAGSDTVTAGTTANSLSLNSNTVQLTWSAGQHTSFLSLNASPEAGTVNLPVTVIASLYDASASPTSAVSGQSVVFTLGSSSCTAATNAAGTAACSLTPAQTGVTTLSASFAGNSSYTAAKNSLGFAVSVASPQAPTVALNVSPTAITAGTSATLSWSSSNAKSCTASGAWSGAEATSGTQSVTPTSAGSYSYTLTCTGNGGSATATAVLSATLVTVTVTAHSGGGLMTWPVIFLLGLLAMLRWRGMGRAPGRRQAVHLGVVSLMGGVAVSLLLAGKPAWADQPPAGGTAVGGSFAWLEPVYVGIRFGSMTTRLHTGNIDAGLAALGYSGLSASTGESEPAGTLYIGYELAPHADLEFDYTHRSANVATLNGTVPTSASVLPLLQDTTELIRGYGNIYALSFRPRVELAPKLMLDPRIGAFLWDTKTAVRALDERFDNTHAGGGLTLGVGIAYRVWRGLEFGAGADFFRGVPNNVGTLYAGTLEWRFGRR